MKLLVVQTGFLGDAVLASAMLRDLKESGGEHSISMLIRSEFAELLAGHPGLDRLHLLDKKRKGSTAAIINELKNERYDAALLSHRSLRSAWIAMRSGIGRRIGFRQSEGAFLLTERIDYGIGFHETQRNAMLLEHLGVTTPREVHLPWLIPQPALVSAMGRRFEDSRRIVVIAPGSVWETKRWTEEGFAELVKILSERGERPVLIGSPGERDLSLRIGTGGGMPEHDIVAGELTLPELIALISIAGRVVSNDSAPLHLAESVGTPVTAIFGPTIPAFGFAPQGEGSLVIGRDDLPCRPCSIHGGRVCPIGTHICMRSIHAIDVASSN